jgi:hypothetical protein
MPSILKHPHPTSRRPTMAPPPMKPCMICNGESCFVVPSIVAHKYLCMLHYYATGAHHRVTYENNTNHVGGKRETTKKSSSSSSSSSSLYVDRRRIEDQMPHVQEIFADAFLELQNDIVEEMARSFRVASTSDDPLALLLNTNQMDDANNAISTSSSRPFRRRRRRTDGQDGKATNDIRGEKSSKDAGHDMEGGFIRDVALPERIRRLQHPRALDDFVSTSTTLDPSTTTSSCGSGRKRPFPMSDTTSGPTNPYHRKQRPPINVWNQVLDDAGNGKDDENTKRDENRHKTKWEELEREMTRDHASSRVCTCGSGDVRIEGNVTSRNNDMMKGEVWGVKDRGEDVIERCRCLACGKAWNEG